MRGEVMATNLEVAQLLDIPEAEYHADHSRVSHSMLEVFLESPRLYRGRFITGEYPQEVTKAMEIGTVFHEIVLGPRFVADAFNYSQNTIACWTPSALPKRAADATSDSGSRYWIEPEGVTREADHWGEVASCAWELPGAVDGIRTAAYCPFSDFLKTDSFIPIPKSVLAKNGHRKGKKWDAFEEEHADKIKLTTKEWSVLPKMLFEVMRHPLARSLIVCDGHREQVVHWIDDDTGLPMKCRIDYIREGLIWIADLKSVASILLHKLRSHFDDFGYPRQADTYRKAIYSKFGLLPKFYFVCCLKTEPYTVEVIELNDTFLQIAEMENQDALCRLKQCMETDHWDLADYGHVKELAPPTWKERQVFGR